MLSKEGLQKLAEKALEQERELTRYAREELGLPPDYHVKVITSIRRIRVPKQAVERPKWVCDQEPNSEDWQKVIELIEGLKRRSKYVRAALWSNMIEAVKRLRDSQNRAYVYKATDLNLFFERKGQPYKLVRLTGRYEASLYSLRVARVPTPSP